MADQVVAVSERKAVQAALDGLCEVRAFVADLDFSERTSAADSIREAIEAIQAALHRLVKARATVEELGSIGRSSCGGFRTRGGAGGPGSA